MQRDAGPGAFGDPGGASLPKAHPADLALHGPRPNPSHGRVTVALDVPAERAAEVVHLDIYDVTGRHVASLIQGQPGAGWHRFVWDLTSSDGSRVSPGVFFVRAEIGGLPQHSKDHRAEVVMRQSLVRWGTMAALLAAPALAPSHACAATRHVPADYATIQAAIDASVAGDSVLVAPGTYTGQPHTGPVCANVVTEHVVAELKPGIVLKSTGGQQVTILDGGPMAPFGPRTVRLVSQDGPPTKVEGFSITSGLVGVAVGCTSSEVTISDCRIWGTDAFGVVVSEATVNLLDCQVEGNTGEAVRVSFGGGVLRVERTRFEGNLDEALVSLRGGSLTVIDCEFVKPLDGRRRVR